MYQVVQVKFPENTYNKGYSYFTDIEGLKVGDPVVVYVHGTTRGFKVAEVSKVRGLSRAERDKAGKFIVQKINVEEYEANVKKHELVLEIRNKLREAKETAEEMLIYQSLANTNPEIKELLTELRGIAPEMVPQLTEK